MARDKVVEGMVTRIVHHPMTTDLRDLCQMVYLILLEYDETKLLDLWRNGQINNFIARIIINQYRSYTSPFYTIFRKHQDKRESLGADINDEVMERVIMICARRNERGK